MTDRYTLGKYVSFQEIKGKRFLGLGSRQFSPGSLEKWRCVLELAELAKKTATLSRLKSKDIKSEVPGTLELLLKNNFIIPATDLPSTSRYSRTLYYYQSIGIFPDDAGLRLKNASVTILGCGGIGNHIGAALASNGVGTLNLVDGDHIELSNLTRQILFKESDVDQRKVDVLAKALRERNSNCTVNTFDLYINSVKDADKIPASDLIIVSADSDDILSIINTYCVKSGTPFINVGYMNDIAVWGPFVIPGKTGCYACGNLRMGITDERTNRDKDHDRLARLNEGFKSATFPPVNASAAALATSDIMRYLSGSAEISSVNKRIGLHDFSLKIETQDFSKNQDCCVCQEK